MTTPIGHTLLSVRGEAQRMVDADQGSVSWTLSAIRENKRTAATDAADALAEMTAEIADLGGQTRTAQTTRAALTWSTQSMRTAPEIAHDPVTGVHGPSGRHQATLSGVLTVRDFSLLAGVEAVITGRDEVEVHSVSWSVDDDNPAWTLVRADAVRAALAKAQDYAAALGGSVVSVEHVADPGLLGGAPNEGQPGLAYAAMAAAAPSETPSLDPVPQLVTAFIEARLTADVGPLPAR